MNHKQSEKLYKKGLENLVGAVNSPVRSFSSVGGKPLFIEKAKGAYIKDVDGNRYIDMVLSYGPIILGHRNRKVEKEISRALKKGYSFGASTNLEIKLAKIICDAFTGIDKIRFVNSGTEAVLSAIRLARAYTRKNKIIKFSGCYHGHTDSMLVAAGSGLATFSLPGSRGVCHEAVKNTLIAEYNNIDSVNKHIKKNKDIAAVILEPVAGNMGVVKPDNAFVKKLQELTKENKILLICDEVMTGFRAQFGGVQELLGIIADITCLGKIIGGGFPVGAYGARNEIMQNVAPVGDMYQAGTLSGNPIAMAAGGATLLELKRQNPYKNFDKISTEFKTILLESAKKYKVEITVNSFGSMLTPFFSREVIKNFEDAKKCDTEKFSVFFWEMIKNGVFLPPSQFESWFLCTVLSAIDISNFKKAVDASMAVVGNK